jgi:hypothetical protein
MHARAAVGPAAVGSAASRAKPQSSKLSHTVTVTRSQGSDRVRP